MLRYPNMITKKEQLTVYFNPKIVIDNSLMYSIESAEKNAGLYLMIGSVADHV